MEKKVSIIMPVYNAEKYLYRSINSIINQTFKDWELIIIDDGSIDNSFSICDDYASRDSRIKVIHKKNEGVAKARQTGIDLACGEYSIHCDADDWVEENMLEELYNNAKYNNSDIVISDYYVNSDNKEYINKQRPSLLEGSSILIEIFNNKIFGSLWNKLIRTNLYRSYNLTFFNDINHCEDLLILVQLLQHKELIISYYPKAFYHYYSNPNSITNNFTRKTYEMRIKFRNKLQNILKIPQAEDIYKQISFNIYLEAIIYGTLSQEEIKDGLKKHKDQIRRVKSLRWKVGFYFLSKGLNNIAYKFIHY